MELTELLDFETREHIKEPLHIIVQCPDDGSIFVRLSPSNYVQRIKDGMDERYAEKTLHLTDMNLRYKVYLSNGNESEEIGGISEEMLQRKFPRVFEYLHGMSRPN